MECNETCGHCRDVNQCLNSNGSCLTGCDAGFKGDVCKTGKYSTVKMHAEVILNRDDSI